MAKLVSQMNLDYIDKSFVLVKVELSDEEFDNDQEYKFLMGDCSFRQVNYVYSRSKDNSSMYGYYICSKTMDRLVSVRDVDFLHDVLCFHTFNIK